MNTAIARRFTKTRKTARRRPISSKPPQTLQDLSSVIQLYDGPKSRLAAMLRTTAKHICEYFDKLPHLIPIS